MTFHGFLLPLLAAVPLACPAVDKEIVWLQRDIALLEDRVRTLQRNAAVRNDETKAALRELLDRVNEVHAATQGLEASEPLAALRAAVEQAAAGAAANALAVKEAVAGLDSRLQRLERQLNNVETALRIMQAPRPPPPSLSEALGGPPAGVTAAGLFQDAMRDKLRGHYDLALQGFQDYLRYFGNTELAVASQYHIGEIAYYRGDLDVAGDAFDRVLERYPRSGKAPDALYMKAQVLDKQGQRTAAAAALNELIRKYANSDAANRAKAQLKRLRTVR